MKYSEILTEKLAALQAEHERIKAEIRADASKRETYKDHIENYWDLERDLKHEIGVEKRRELDVGDGCTYHLYSDSHACTVIKRTPKTITIQRDKAILSPDFKPEWIPGGFAAHCTNQYEQEYTYERDPNGEIIKAYWSEKRGGFVYLDKIVSLGRHEFYDYNF
jgi:hypothetical protein